MAIASLSPMTHLLHHEGIREFFVEIIEARVDRGWLIALSS
jgi:hypothetical protein